MNPWQNTKLKVRQTIFNKSFFRFVFSFVAVVAGVLMFILVVGVGSGL
jgi:hypothetical protein